MEIVKGGLFMKYVRKCPICKKKATKRIGKLDFCDTHAKEIHKNHAKYVLTETHIFSISKYPVYGYTCLNVF